MTYVLYHKNCPDGWTAAWVAHNYFGDDNTVRYIPVAYGDELPEIRDGSVVFILDFSFSRPILEELNKRTHLKVLDHHKTAQAALEGLDYCEFDMTRSGAMLTHNYFNPGFADKRSPKIVQYIQDHDLWRHELPNSVEITNYLRSFPYTFEAWDAAAEKLDYELSGAVSEGKALLRLEQNLVKRMAEEVQWFWVGGYRVPFANATVFFSEVPRELMEKFPDAPFAGYYFDRGDGKVQWGLRGRKDGVDVSEVAKKYGGGGHRAAAGFETKKGEIE